MASDFQQRFHEALCRWLVKQWEKEPEEFYGMPDRVTGYSYTPEHETGFCDTCAGWEPDRIEIDYVTAAGLSDRWDTEISFDQLIRELN